MEWNHVMQTAADRIRRADHVVVITGAGVSAESGIDTYRGVGGLWEKHDVNEVATGTALRRDPEKVWRFLLRLREHVREASPNAAHRAIADLENRVRAVRVITQNIDGLHQAAGSREVLEIHGNVREARDEITGAIHALDDLDLERLPPVCADTGHVLRPNVLYFEEEYSPLLMSRASSWVREAEVIVVVGTSGMVPTPYFLAHEGKAAGAFVIDVNLERATPMFGAGSELADVFLQGKAGTVLPRVLDLI